MSDILGIEKKRNLRDLGGYKTQNGKHVKKGYFFRSSRLMDFDQAELKILNSLNIKKIYDLRSKEEVKDSPDPTLKGAEYIHSSAAARADGTEVNFSPAALIAENVYSKECNDEFTHKVYGNLPFSYAYKRMFEDIVAGNVPILFHCSAGKDRTGIAAILILLALGVDEETAMYDYMLTNEYRKEYIERFRKDFPLTKLDGELAGMLLAYEGVTYTNADYSLKRIKEKYENYDEYFEKEYNLDKDALQRLRDLYTE
ncbi:tyrosine-protein phosphatase [uncultured Solobacterium sp.]|uniref:tyrosine-protein phosphatase n=1 Tax=uncultured Solobacterium sp. TaxID=747375 RepID=UPI0028D68BED|nr:tyrosine-protein phosphatase [uncultured Solobacterium sp.]